MGKMAAERSIYLGVDIGGTKVAAGLVDARGKILCKTRVPMSSTGSEAEGLASVEQAIEAAMGMKPRLRDAVAAIGISSPGPLDPRAGVIINPPNLPCWRNLQITKKLKTRRRLPIHLDNDANAAALAEAAWGAGQGYDSVFYATLGTGIGAGIVFGGKIYHGRTGCAAEGGHVSIDFHGPKCACGKLGCIEALAAGPAVAKRARGKLATSGAAAERLLERAGGKAEGITAEVVAEAWRAGDALAASILQETADLLTVWLGSIVDLLEPDVIIFGGGMGALMSEWFGYIRERLAKWSINSRCEEIPMVRARYGEDSGIAGGAALFLPAKQLLSRSGKRTG